MIEIALTLLIVAFVNIAIISHCSKEAMKHTRDSEMNDANWFYLIVWIGILLVGIGLIWLKEKLNL